MTKEAKYEERQDSPWYTGASNPHINGVHDNTDDATVWQDKVLDMPVLLNEDDPNVYIERADQGFMVYVGPDKLAFTDRVDAAEWLLGWLGFEDEIVESVLDILWDADELYDILSDCVAGVDYDELEHVDCRGALDVAKAAQAYVEVQPGRLCEHEYDQLVEAVKKWRGE